MLKKLLTAVAATAAAALVMQGGANSGTLNEILSRGKIRVAVMQDFAPFGALNTALEPEGYDIDVAKRIAESLGVKVELVPTTGANRIPFLQTDKVDVVAAALGANPDRAKVIWFSSAYAPFFSGIYTKKGVKIKTYEDLAGKSVGVARGNLEDLELSKVAPPSANIMRFEDNATTAAAWISGQVEVLAIGNTAAALIAKNNPSLEIENKIIIKNSPVFLGVSKGNEDLLRWLNVFIMHQRVGGGLNELSIKWFGQPLPTDMPTL